LNGESQNFYLNGNLKNSANYTNRRKNGKSTEWYENGKLRRELYYDIDKITDGTIIEYDEMGQKQLELEYRLGVILSEYSYKNNKQIVYYDYQLGKKKSEGNLLNRLNDGHWTEWYGNGQKSFEGNYTNGKREGKGAEYNEAGVIIWDGEYKEGRINGKGVLHENSITYKGDWAAGKKNGAFTEISDNGEKAEGQYIDNIKDGLWSEWFPNGNKKTEILYTKGNLVNGTYSEWYDNGQIKESKKYLNLQLNGIHSKWFSNGKLESTLNYANGSVVNGQYFYYESNGDIIKESNYNDGKILSEYMYSGKLKNGNFVEYYGDGSKKMEGKYDYGKRKVEQRYGASLKAHNFISGVVRVIGTAALIVALVALKTVTG